MRGEIQRKPWVIGSLQVDVEENHWRRGEGLGRRIAHHAKRKERNTVLGAAARDQFRFHINGGRACGLCDFLSLLNGIDDRRHRQKVPAMDGRIAARMDLVQLNG
jgi:hypothetical protein